MILFSFAGQAVAPSSHRTIVLTYHDVIARRGPGSLWFDCTASELASQLDWLQRRGAHFITLDELYQALSKGAKLPPHAVAITFADGYQGFWDFGYPELKKRGIPATMFVHTGFVGDRSHGRPKMTWSELGRLQASGLVQIESQTVSHPADLGQLSESDQWRELTESKRTLETLLGKTVHFIAYPNGKFSEVSERLAKRAGYWMGFSERTHPAELSSSIFSVNRYVHTKYRTAWSASK